MIRGRSVYIHLSLWTENNYFPLMQRIQIIEKQNKTMLAEKEISACTKISYIYMQLKPVDFIDVINQNI